MTDTAALIAEINTEVERDEDRLDAEEKAAMLNPEELQQAYLMAEAARDERQIAIVKEAISIQETRKRTPSFTEENGARIGSGSPKRNESPIEYRCLSNISSRPISWLWPGRIARGKVSMLAGNPGLGKSQLTASMAATVTTGGLWPVDNTQCEIGSVVLLSAEDDAEDTIRPRLEAAGADLQRVFILDAVKGTNGERRSFNLKEDIPRLEHMFRKIGGAALIIIDPISAYLGGTDSHKNADIRALLAPLSDFAAKNGAAVVCVSHLNKGGSSEAITRVTGSLAFVAAARSAWVVAKDSNDPDRRLFLPLKNNIGNDTTGLAFRIESVELPGGICTSRVSWDDENVAITADEAMRPLENHEEPSALQEAKNFLTELLRDGPQSSKQIRADAEGAGHSWRTIQRAQKDLGIIPVKDGMRCGWSWHLPSKVAKEDEECHPNNMEAFGDLGDLREAPEAISLVAEVEDAGSRFEPDMDNIEDAVIVSQLALF